MENLQRGNAYDDPIIIDSSEDSEESTLTFQDLESVDSTADVNSFPDLHNPVQPAQMVYNAAGIIVATEHPFSWEHRRQDLQNDPSNQAPARLLSDGGLHNVPDEAPRLQAEGIGVTSLTQGQSSGARNEPAQMIYNAAGIHVATEHPFGLEHRRQDLQNDPLNHAPARLLIDGGLHNVPDEAPGLQAEGIGVTSLTQGQSSRARNEYIYPEDIPSNKLPRIGHGEEGSSKGDIGSSKGKGKE